MPWYLYDGRVISLDQNFIFDEESHNRKSKNNFSCFSILFRDAPIRNGYYTFSHKRGSAIENLSEKF